MRVSIMHVRLLLSLTDQRIVHSMLEREVHSLRRSYGHRRSLFLLGTWHCTNFSIVRRIRFASNRACRAGEYHTRIGVAARLGKRLEGGRLVRRVIRVTTSGSCWPPRCIRMQPAFLQPPRGRKPVSLERSRYRVPVFLVIRRKCLGRRCMISCRPSRRMFLI